MGRITKEELSENLINELKNSEKIAFNDENFVSTNVKDAIKENNAGVRSALTKAEQAFQSASNGKQKIATAITGKGVDASGTDTFDVLAGKINNIEQFESPLLLNECGVLATLSTRTNLFDLKNMTYCDRGNGKVLLFEGLILYEYDLNTLSKKYINKVNARPTINCVLLDDILYYVSSGNFMAYNLKTNRLLTKNNENGEVACLVVYNNNIYSIGGEKSDWNWGQTTFMKYNIADDTWEKLPVMPAPFNNSSVTFIYNNKLYVIGQYRGGEPVFMITYDSNTNTWASDKIAMQNVALAFTKGDRAYLISNGNDVVVYDIPANTKTSISSSKGPFVYPYSLGKYTPIYFNNKIYYFGFPKSSGSSGYIGTINSYIGCFDLDTEKFCIVSEMYPLAYRYPGACCDNNEMYLNGNAYNARYEDFSSSIRLWRYNFKSLTWRPIIPDGLYGKNKQGFIAMHNNKVYFGFEKTGSTSVSGSGKSDLYYYNPTTEDIVEVKKDIETNLQYNNSIIYNNSIYTFGYKSLCIYNLTSNVYTKYPVSFEGFGKPFIYNNSIYVFTEIKTLYKLNNDKSLTIIDGDVSSAASIQSIFNIKNKYYISSDSTIYEFNPENMSICNISAEHNIAASYCSNDNYFYIIGDKNSNGEGAPGMKIFIP